MKKSYLLIVFALYTCILPIKSNAQSGSVDFQVFYDELSPYGTWIENPDYGYVWIPDVDADFVPYTTNGYWAYTDNGWTWVSDFSWGWAPFHYGRWYTDDRYGSVWVPGYQWGPGWVSWRSSDNYFGWAPMRPGISFNLYFSNHFSVPYNDWTFVSGRNFGRRNSNEFYINHTMNTTIIRNTNIINNPKTDRIRNVTYSAGPVRNEVEKHSGRTVPLYAIKENEQHGQRISNGQMQMYRPNVRPASNGNRPVPNNVTSLDNVKTKEEKKLQRPTPNQTNPPIRQEQPQQNQGYPPRKLEPQQQRQNLPEQRQEQPRQNQPQPQRQEQQQPRQYPQPQRQEPQPQPQRQNQPPQKQNTPPNKQQPPPKQNSNPQKPRRDTVHHLTPDLKIQLN